MDCGAGCGLSKSAASPGSLMLAACKGSKRLCWFRDVWYSNVPWTLRSLYAVGVGFKVAGRGVVVSSFPESTQR